MCTMWTKKIWMTSKDSQLRRSSLTFSCQYGYLVCGSLSIDLYSNCIYFHCKYRNYDVMLLVSRYYPPIFTAYDPFTSYLHQFQLWIKALTLPVLHEGVLSRYGDTGVLVSFCTHSAEVRVTVDGGQPFLAFGLPMSGLSLNDFLWLREDPSTSTE